MIKSLKLLAFLYMIFYSTLASAGEIALDHRVDNFFDALIMSFEQRHRAEDVLSEWNEIEMEFTNENGIAGKGDCFEKSKGEVILILRVEKSGVISGAYTSKDNAKATCLVENHKGIVLPQPPFGPVYVLKRMM